MGGEQENGVECRGMSSRKSGEAGQGGGVKRQNREAKERQSEKTR